MLWPAAGLYGLLVWFRNLGYNRGWFATYSVDVPVISVGNLSAGGTGKTPAAIWLMEQLRVRGHTPAYLSRGYGRRTRSLLFVDADRHTAAEVGDEALMVARRFPELPVAVCADRVAGAQALIRAFQPDCIVLDDALQHRRLARDWNLVLTDARRPFWRDALIPVGRLRESWRGLNRADLLWVNKVDTQTDRQAYRGRWAGPLVFSSMRPVGIRSMYSDLSDLTLEQLRNMVGVAFCGVGNPEHFRTTLEGLGVRVVWFNAFPDHHALTLTEVLRIRAAWEHMAARESGGQQCQRCLLLTTEKDFCRMSAEALNAWQGLPGYYLQVALKLESGRDALEHGLDSLFTQRAASAED